MAPHLLRHALKTVPSLLSAPDLQHPGWRRFGARQGRMATGAESPAPGCSVAASVDTWHPLLQSVREAVCVCPTPRGRHASAPRPGRGSPGSHCTSHEASCAHPPPLDPPDPRSKQLTGEKPAEVYLANSRTRWRKTERRGMGRQTPAPPLLPESASAPRKVRIQPVGIRLGVRISALRVAHIFATSFLSHLPWAPSRAWLRRCPPA